MVLSGVYTKSNRIVGFECVVLNSQHTHSFGLAEAAHAIRPLCGEVAGAKAVHVSVHPEMDGVG
jgi:hypothetical protein